jgi:hypothetical protein
MRIRYLLLMLLCGLYLSGNTVFAPYGVPLQSYGNDVYGLGMGDTGISDLNRINCNQDNPSLLVTASNVTLSTALNMGYFWYKDDVKSFRDDAMYLPYFTLSVPLQNHRLGISLNSVYSGNLDTVAKGLSTGGTDGVSYDEVIRKTEDVFRTSLHYALKNRYINIGASLIYYFGNRLNYWSLDFEDSSYIDSKYEYEKKYSGLGYKAGVSKMLGNLSLGASFEPSVNLSGSYIFRYNFAPEEDTLSEDTKLYKVPQNLNAGFTYMFTKTFKLSMESNYIYWSRISDRYKSDTGQMRSYHDSWRLSGGVSYDPVSGYGKWYERIPLRMGLSYSELPFESEDAVVKELSVSAGSTIQLDSPGRKLDYAIRYVHRGNMENTGYRDESLQFIISVTGFDIFIKTPKRTEPREIPKVDTGMGLREDTQ